MKQENLLNQTLSKKSMKIFWTTFWRMGIFLLLVSQPIGYAVFFIYDLLPSLGVLGVKIKPTITYLLLSLVFFALNLNIFGSFKRFLWVNAPIQLAKADTIFKIYGFAVLFLALVNMTLALGATEVFWSETRLLLAFNVFLIPFLFVFNKSFRSQVEQ
jgi:hypothetical protein